VLQPGRCFIREGCDAYGSKIREEEEYTRQGRDIPTAVNKYAKKKNMYATVL